MGQKTNPISLRLNIDRHFDSCWYPGRPSDYGHYVQTDFNIRDYLKSLFQSLGLHTGRMNVQMFPKKLHIHYFFHPDPLRTSKRRRLQNMRTPQRSRGLSFLRSVRENQKLTSTAPLLTFREALALERQKNLNSKSSKDIQGKTQMKRSPGIHFLDRKRPKISTFQETLEALNFSTSSKKSGEAEKLFVFHGFSLNESSQNLFHQEIDFTQFILKNRMTLTGSQGASLRKNFFDKGYEVITPLDIRHKKHKSFFEDYLKSFQDIVKKSSQNSATLGALESLCRLLMIPQPFSNSLGQAKLVMPIQSHKFENFSSSNQLLGEYSTLFQGLGEVKRSDEEISSDHKELTSPNLEVSNSTLWSDFHHQRSLFPKEKYLNHIEKMISQCFETGTTLVPMKITSRTRSAHFLCQTVIQQFQKNLSFRQIYKNLFKDIQADPSVQGIRLVCSGRFGGIEMARVESRKYGQTSLHVFSSHIDYADGHALTSSGLLGVKIWISYRPTTLQSPLWSNEQKKSF